MRVPLSWLGEFVELPKNATPESVMAELVKVGLEEEGKHSFDLVGPIVVGKVLDFVEEPQSNGKTIRWCQVEVGKGDVRGIVCGARNFEVGDKVVVTLPGAVLLALVGILPGIFQLVFGMSQGFSTFFGGTSLLILVGVVLDTLQQIESYLLMRKHEGLMQSGRVRGRSEVIGR